MELIYSPTSDHALQLLKQGTTEFVFEGYVIKRLECGGFSCYSQDMAPRDRILINQLLNSDSLEGPQVLPGGGRILDVTKGESKKCYQSYQAKQYISDMISNDAPKCIPPAVLTLFAQTIYMNFCQNENAVDRKAAGRATVAKNDAWFFPKSVSESGTLETIPKAIFWEKDGADSRAVKGMCWNFNFYWHIQFEGKFRRHEKRTSFTASCTKTTLKVELPPLQTVQCKPF